MKQTKTKLVVTVEGIGIDAFASLSYVANQIMRDNADNGNVSITTAKIPEEIKWKTTTEEIEI